MPKYKEIKINVEVKPEMILGEALRKIAAAHVNQIGKKDTKKQKDE